MAEAHASNAQCTAWLGTHLCALVPQVVGHLVGWLLVLLLLGKLIKEAVVLGACVGGLGLRDLLGLRHCLGLRSLRRDLLGHGVGFDAAGNAQVR